jgi:hypothetical protein
MGTGRFWVWLRKTATSASVARASAPLWRATWWDLRWARSREAARGLKASIASPISATAPTIRIGCQLKSWPVSLPEPSGSGRGVSRRPPR